MPEDHRGQQGRGSRRRPAAAGPLTFTHPATRHPRRPPPHRRPRSPTPLRRQRRKQADLLRAPQATAERGAAPALSRTQQAALQERLRGGQRGLAGQQAQRVQRLDGVPLPAAGGGGVCARASVNVFCARGGGS